MIQTTKLKPGAQKRDDDSVPTATRGRSSASGGSSSQLHKPGDKTAKVASAAPKGDHVTADTMGPGSGPPKTPDASPPGRTKLPSPRDKSPPAPTAYAIVKMLNAIHWRPQSSGRATVEAWLQEVVAQSGRNTKREAAVQRAALHEALIAEDITSAKHPSQKHPHNCVGNPYAFRIWPDKVQALVAFDRVVGGPHVPKSLGRGTYGPVVLYDPRVTIVAINPTDDAQVDIKFAEALPTHRTNFDTLLRHLRLPRKRDAEGYKAATIAGLKQLRDVCGPHRAYLHDVLLPALHKAGPPQLLPTFGLCALDAIKQAIAQCPRDPNGTIAFLEDYVAQEQQMIAAYPDHLEMPRLPHESQGSDFASA